MPDYTAVTRSFPSFASPRFRIVLVGLVAVFCLILITSWNGVGTQTLRQQLAKHIGPPADTNEEVAICIATKDNSRDLPEFFIHHYHHHGIRRFYIMDDGSNPPLSTFKDYGIPRTALTFQWIDPKTKVVPMQDHIYSECMRLFGPLHKWMAVIDADEYIETRNGETLHGILKEFEVEGVGALAMNWRLHNSNNVLKRPESVRKAFTSCAADPTGPPPDRWRDNRLVKSIVRTALYEDPPYSPHLFRTINGTRTVGEHMDVLEDKCCLRTPITRDRIALHHFTLRSREQFEEKMGTWTDKGWSYWDHIEGLPREECFEMTKYDP